MIRTKDEAKWHGRISYKDYKEDIVDPAEVEKKIREGRKCLMHFEVFQRSKYTFLKILHNYVCSPG